MRAERRGPAVRDSSGNTGGRGALRKAPIDLQDRSGGIYAQGKAESGRTRWSRRRSAAESAAAAVGRISLGVKRTGEPGAGEPPARFDVAGGGGGFTAGGIGGPPQGKGGAGEGPATGNP